MPKNFSVFLVEKVGRLLLKGIRKPDREVEDIFLKYKTEINELYKQKLYWHGTGRFQYVSEKGKVEDILKMIIGSDGLVPHKKFAQIDNREKLRNTISLSKIRMYASIFAQMHKDAGSKEYFLFGKRLFWLLAILFCNFLDNPIRILSQTLHYSLLGGKEQMISMQSRVCRKERIKDFKLFILQYLHMSTLNSDISGNYPILIAVKREGIKLLKPVHRIDLYEEKTEEPIHFSGVSHIEVPYAAIKSTSSILREAHKNIRIIPIEASEFYLYEKFSIKDLLSPI
ncbi:hypothetical protein JW766_00760 [Candidatus Dojkabacteria bacterium]|nr:hypothetical protein [Candidatus Dojkabacteria bacterium]